MAHSPRTGEADLDPEFKSRSLLGVALAALLLLAPFSFNHLRQGRLLLAAGTGVVVLVFAWLAWTASRGEYRPWVGFAALTPPILILIFVAFREQGVIGALWSYPAALAFYFTLEERPAWISNAALICVVVFASWNVLEPDVAVRAWATLAGVVVFAGIFVRVIGRQRSALVERAVTDPLTGLRNRSMLATTLVQAAERARRTGSPMTLLALDLDHFKAINDTYGHDIGDRVLVATAEVIRDRIRLTDTAFRLGGEEFLIFLFGTDAERAGAVAADLRRTLEARTLLPDRPVTVSIGVSSIGPEEAWQAWLKRADENLYAAKVSGRNRVVA